MINYKFIIRICFCLSLLIGAQSCNKSTEKDPISTGKQTTPVNSSDSDVLSNPIVIKDVDPSLSEWIEFKELNLLITNIANGKIEVLEGSQEMLRDLFSALVVQIPESVNSNSIISRIKVLETLAYKLNVEYGNNQNNSIEFELTRDSLLIAYSNLIFQITKTLEKKSQFILKTN